MGPRGGDPGTYRGVEYGSGWLRHVVSQGRPGLGLRDQRVRARQRRPVQVSEVRASERPGSTKVLPHCHRAALAARDRRAGPKRVKGCPQLDVADEPAVAGDRVGRISAERRQSIFAAAQDAIDARGAHGARPWCHGSRGRPDCANGEDCRQCESIALDEVTPDLDPAGPGTDQQPWRIRAVEEPRQGRDPASGDFACDASFRAAWHVDRDMGAVALQRRARRHRASELRGSGRGDGGQPCGDAGTHLDRWGCDLGLGAIGGDRPAPRPAIGVGIGDVDPPAWDGESMDDVSEVDDSAIEANDELVFDADNRTYPRAPRDRPDGLDRRAKARRGGGLARRCIGHVGSGPSAAQRVIITLRSRLAQTSIPRRRLRA